MMTSSWRQTPYNLVDVSRRFEGTPCVRAKCRKADSNQESKGFWRWCITLRITGFLDSVHRPVFQITRKHDVSETGSVSVFRWGRETPTLLVIQWLRLALSKEPNRVCVYLLSHEDGNWSSFRNVVFSSYLEFRTMDEVQKPSDSE
jgi:hypothetical protein